MEYFDPTTFLLFLQEKGILLELDDERNLDISAPKGSLNQELIHNIKEHKLELVSFLENTLTDRDQSIGALTSLSTAEKEQLLIDFNQSTVDYPQDQTLVDWFFAQATETPDEIAIVFKNQQLTYRELDEQSNQMATYLLEEHQVQPDDLIGLQLKKSNWLIIALLGILKSGAGYVPIDPDYPQQRIDFITKDSQCKLCINEQTLAQFQKIQAKYSIEMPDSTVCSHHLAYVIYTSGSTGTPKGVLIEHRNVVNLIAYQTAFFGVQATDRFILFSNISFDASIEQLFLALLNGARLYLPTKEDLLDRKRFEQLLQECEINHLHAVPSFLRTISPNASLSLKRLVSGGELFDPTILTKFGSSTAVYNEYGPTETTVTSIEYEVNEANYSETLIGRPVGNTTCYILDDTKKLLPQGHIGELYLGGEGVARGYLNRPELTAERFILHPFNVGERLYRTGDLARWTSDGQLEFLGRVDTQIKLRGYRIELGEIESQLKKQGQIAESVVLVKENVGEKYLLAYYAAEQALPVPALIEYLSGNLPDYMIPHHYIHLSEFPLTPNGKLDRKTLQNKEVKINKDYVASTNAMEVQLTQIWSSILKIPADEISTRSSFFNLGGHSLIANELLSKIHRQFGISFTAKELFRKNTIQLIAQHIQEDREQKGKGRSMANRLGRSVSQNRKPWFDREQMLQTVKQLDLNAEHYPVYHRQKREFLQFLQFNKYDFNLIFHLQIFNLDPTAIDQTIQTIFQRHESLRTTFLVADGQIRQKIHPHYPPEFVIDHLSLLGTDDRDQDLDAIYKKMSGQAFDFEQCLVAIKIIEVLPDVHGVIVAIHHAISDKKSAEILKEEMEILYDAYKNKQTPQLPDLPLQLKEYAFWVNTFLLSHKGRRSKQFYKMAITKSLLANGETNQSSQVSYRDQITKELRSDFEKTGLKYSEAFGTLAKLYPEPGASYTVFLENDKLQQLKKIAAYCDSSFFMLLISTFAVLIHQTQKLKHVRLCLPYSTRIFEEFERLSGWLSSEIIACLEIEDQLSIKDWVAVVTKKVLDTADHRLYPHEQLLDDFAIPLDVLVPYFLNLLKTEENFTGSTVAAHQNNRSGYFGLNCTIHEFNNGLSFELQYNCNQYSPSIIEEMMSNYLALFACLNETPDLPLSAIAQSLTTSTKLLNT